MDKREIEADRVEWLHSDEPDTLPADDVLRLARRRKKVRGLPRPEGLPAGGWYSVQVRREGLRYLYYRWQENGNTFTRSLGRLN